jgi:hypothetical protein
MHELKKSIKIGWFSQKSELKNSKKTRVYFKSFGQNRIQKFEVTNAAKFGKEKTVEKTRIKWKPVGS